MKYLETKKKPVINYELEIKKVSMVQRKISVSKVHDSILKILQQENNSKNYLPLVCRKDNRYH